MVSLSSNTASDLLQQVAKALQPSFAPNHPEWLPKCAHAKDAAADLRAWISSTTTLEDLSAVYNRLKIRYSTSEIYLDGKLIENFEQDVNKLYRQDKEGYSYVLLTPGEQKLISLGFKIALPDLPDPFTACYRISPRSGLALKHGLMVTNSPGLVDCYYRNEVGVILKNTGDSCHFFSHGARVAQGAYELLVAQSTWTAESLITSELDETIRKGGFGHTGL
jgi:dUTP pyrophosphatase